MPAGKDDLHYIANELSALMTFFSELKQNQTSPDEIISKFAPPCHVALENINQQIIVARNRSRFERLIRALFTS